MTKRQKLAYIRKRQEILIERFLNSNESTTRHTYTCKLFYPEYSDLNTNNDSDEVRHYQKFLVKNYPEFFQLEYDEAVYAIKNYELFSPSNREIGPRMEFLEEYYRQVKAGTAWVD